MKKLLTRAAPLLLTLFILCQSVRAAQFLVPVGQLIGLSLHDDTVTVASFDKPLGEPAKAAGLAVGDQITSIDRQQIRCADDIRKALDQSNGTVQVSILRNGKAKTLHLTPQITSDGPRLGVYLKEGVNGVGTVTFYDPDTGRFGALGHGVNDCNGTLLSMRQGTAFEATILSVRKGNIGTPGQLMGTLNSSAPIGKLTKNTVQGVFGVTEHGWQGERLPVSSEVRTGDAKILSTVQDSSVQEYSVEILKIYPSAQHTGRNMLLRVTDPQLLEITGVIVQGMGVSYNKDNQGNP